MANRRMISKTILCSDAFTELSPRTRLLYVYMILEADDDGIIGTVKNALFLSGANAKDLKTLVEKNYVIKFDSDVYAIRHWLLMNKVQGTRKAVTAYIDELSHLAILPDKTYKFCQQNVDNLLTQSKSISSQYSLNQDSTVEVRITDDSEVIIAENDVNQALSFMQNPDFKTAHKCFSEKIGALNQPEHYTLLNNLLNEAGLNGLLVCIDFMAKQTAGKTVPYLEKIVKTHPELLEG